MTQRLAPLSPPYSPEVTEDLAKLSPGGIPVLGLFRTVAHNPRVLRRMRRGGLLDPGAVSVREREIAILRTTARCGAEYEWGVHVALFGGAARFSEEEIAATVLGGPESPCWSPRERLVVALADALHASARVPDRLYADLEEAFPAAAIVELVTLVGQYHHVSFVVNALGVALEPWAPRFPGSPLHGGSA